MYSFELDGFAADFPLYVLLFIETTPDGRKVQKGTADAVFEDGTRAIILFTDEHLALRYIEQLGDDGKGFAAGRFESPQKLADYLEGLPTAFTAVTFDGEAMQRKSLAPTSIRDAIECFRGLSDG